FTTVKDASDNTPINHAWSKIEGYFTGVTDSLGESLFYAPEDNYNIITNKFGYYPDTTNLTLIKDGTINLDVLLEPAIPELTLNTNLIEFDSLNIQSASLDSLYISNNGYTVLHLEIESSIISGFNLDSLVGSVLRPGDELLMRIFFIPTEAIDYEGTIFITSEAGTDTVYLSGIGTSIGIEDDPNLLPEKITLYQNYPNPFNPTTIIKYDLTEFSNVKLSIYDINGKLVQTLLNSYMPAGRYEIEWNASGIASGIYIYSIESGNAVLNKKLILLK
ncbi:MAG: T9SS type A sorting domain-containing protein, partial [Candidatus Marinimicrobia bacterium]|nr:T9SS type A sorting domain-containing protein [Candidatus Neomarinimicrobiota bacterium]